MRCVLSIGALAMLATTLVVADNSDAIVFREESESNTQTRYVPAEELARRALQAATSSTNAFTRKFFKKVVEEQSGNLICSPIGAWLATSMTSYGAIGDTNRDMRVALELPQADWTTKVGIRRLVDKLSSYRSVEVTVANKLYLNSSVTPKPDFASIARNDFRSEVEVVDVLRPEYASSAINEWCFEKTNDFFEDIVSPNDFIPPPAVLIFNSAYLKGAWSQPFNPAFTHAEQSFYVNNNEEKRVTTVWVSGTFRYGTLQKLDASYVELPYKSEDDKHKISMFVILPSRRDGLADLEAKFDTVRVSDLIDRSTMMNVDVILPKFKFESTIELIKKMGMQSVFQDPNFSRIVDQPRLFVTKVEQKTLIEVNEAGIEVAAITHAAMYSKSVAQNSNANHPFTVLTGVEKAATSSKSVSQRFNADHPFMILIATTSEAPVTLFAGRYTGPQ